MGMSFIPLSQKVTTGNITASGDLNVNPYDLLATDVKCDTAEASEFVGVVGNFEHVVIDDTMVIKTSYNITLLDDIVSISINAGETVPLCIMPHGAVLSGVLRMRSSKAIPAYLTVVTPQHTISAFTITTSYQEFNITNAHTLTLNVSGSTTLEFNQFTVN